jgi:hypothetical protein
VQVPDEVPYSDYTKESPAYVEAGGVGVIDGRIKMHFDAVKNELVVDRMEAETIAKTKSGLGLWTRGDRHTALDGKKAALGHGGLSVCGVGGIRRSSIC